MINYNLIKKGEYQEKYTSHVQGNSEELIVQAPQFEVVRFVMPKGTTSVFRKLAQGLVEVYYIEEGKIVLYDTPEDPRVLYMGDIFTISGGCDDIPFQVREDTRLFCSSNSNQYEHDKQDVSVLMDLLNQLQVQDGDTLQHCTRVQKLAMETVKYMKIGYDAAALFIASRYHDIGKIQIPLSILLKPDALSEEEYKIMKKHSQYSYDILKDYYQGKICQIVLSHHERYDGTGYPRGLKGEDIKIEARIIAVCDAYDAMVTVRPYNKGKTHQQAVDELLRNKGKQFDPDCVDALIQYFAHENM